MECAETRTSLAVAEAQTHRLLQAHDDDKAAHRRKLDLLQAQLQRCKDDQETAVRQHSTQVNDLKDEYKALLQRAKTEHKEAFARMRGANDKTIQTMQEDHLHVIKKEYEEISLQVRKMEKEHEKTIQNMEERFR